ncbi:hypothetical protein POM88_001717 [Heracleum sosnowskyi]|uniref:DUF7026 domain-containing protein n=1 Tax=Heracleum sosnowskyi TaxID=360622 RepID=A0AAD8JD27_9APIA|nr:hypothetical protein POM88_001717 [Heracleum sosnowskyi]
MFSINSINSSLSPTFKFLKTHESNTQISTWASLFSPKTQPLCTSSSSTHFSHKPTKILAKKKNSDAELASDLASEIEKLKTHLAKKEEAVKKKEEAMKKSVEILFTEMCKYLEMQESEVKKKWKSMNDDEKLGLVNEFLAEWGGDFHPLSAKSVIEMVDVVQDVDYENGNVASDDDEASSSMSFSSLFKFLGLFRDK